MGMITRLALKENSLMKKTGLTYCLTKKLYYLLILLSVLSVGAGCHKSSQSNPCEGLLNEGTPTMVGLIFVDGQTGENILLSKNTDTASVTITPQATDAHLDGAVIVKDSGSVMYGALMFHIADTKKGLFKYKIDIPDVGSTTLSYTNKEERANDNCNSYYIRVTDPVIEDHQFTVTRTGFRLIFKVTL